MIYNTNNKYGLPTKLFHWILAIPLICVPFLMYWVQTWPGSEWKNFAYFMHKSGGLLFLVLVSLRFGWRMLNRQPDLPRDLSVMIKKSIRLGHYSLYVVMFLMPLSGLFSSLYGGYSVPFFGVFEIQAFMKNESLGNFFGAAHENLAIVLLSLIGLHILGALWHHFIRKDNILRRMWFS